MRERIDAVLFDLDGTLHERALAFRAWAHAFARERIGLEIDDADEAVAFLTALDAGGRGPKETMFAAVIERWPIVAGPPAAMVDVFRAELRSFVTPDPAAIRLLHDLDANSIPWGIVSNGSAAQHDKLAALGLADRTPCVVISEQVGLRKPDPAIFLLAAHRLGVEPERTLFVGDHPAHDIVGAASAGMQTVWIRRGASWPKALSAVERSLAIDSLDDLWPIMSMTSGTCANPD